MFKKSEIVCNYGYKGKIIKECIMGKDGLPEWSSTLSECSLSTSMVVLIILLTIIIGLLLFIITVYILSKCNTNNNKYL